MGFKEFMMHMARTASNLGPSARGVVLAVLLSSMAACSSAVEQDEADISDSEKMQLINFIRACWYSPIDAAPRGDFVVTIVMQMNRDATLQSAKISEPDLERVSDPEYKNFAQGALRAVQKCGENGRKFPINQDRDYEIWSQIRARFKESDLY